MRIISHRGNTNGPSKNENDPLLIAEVTQKYDCEVDVWQDFKGVMYLGHDRGEYEVHPDFFYNRQARLWCHAKNLAALNTLIHMGVNCFYHTVDDFVLTSHKFVWTTNYRVVSPRLVVVDTDKDWSKKGYYDIFGVCVDYVT